MLYTFVLHADAGVQRQMTRARVTFLLLFTFRNTVCFQTVGKIKVNSLPIRSKIPFYTEAYRTTHTIL